MRVRPKGVRPEPGAEVRLSLGVIAARCRVVHVVDGPGRAGFAYGSLCGHPERGEEAFVVHRDADGTWFTITGFSRPAAWYARIAAPLTRLVQRRITTAYLRSFGSSDLT